MRLRKNAKMRSCAVVARKGGVGKTFAAISLAVNAAFGGPDKKLPKLNVLFIDVDSQQNSSYFFLKYQGAELLFEKVKLPIHPSCEEQKVYNITDIFLGNDFMEYPTQYPNLFIIPSDGNIDTFNGKVSTDNEEDNISRMAGDKFRALLGFIEEDFDLIVIDTPPSKTHAATAALSASSDCLVVGKLDSWNSEMAIPGVLNDIDKNNTMFRDKHDPINICGILLNLLSSKKLTNDEKKHLTKISQDHGQHLSKNLLFVDRVAFKTTEMPQDPQNYDYMKDEDTANLMRKFYYHMTDTMLREIYEEAGVNVDNFLAEMMPKDK